MGNFPSVDLLRLTYPDKKYHMVLNRTQLLFFETTVDLGVGHRRYHLQNWLAFSFLLDWFLGLPLRLSEIMCFMTYGRE